MTANETREEGIDFTTPYYDSEGMIMIVRKDGEEAKFTDIQQFSGKNVVGQKGTNYDDVIDQIKGVHHATAKATYPEMVVALQQGDVDGITAVSYTHLTLPTIYSVYISVVAVALKKKKQDIKEN